MCFKYALEHAANKDRGPNDDTRSTADSVKAVLRRTTGVLRNQHREAIMSWYWKLIRNIWQHVKLKDVDDKKNYVDLSELALHLPAFLPGAVDAMAQNDIRLQRDSSSEESSES
jgi:hypothetical protein